MKNIFKRAPAPHSKKTEAMAQGAEAPRTHRLLTMLRKVGYISLGLITVTVVSFKLLTIDVSLHRKDTATYSDSKRVATLHPGDPVPQIFAAKVPIKNYSPGERVGFEIVNEAWRQPFWRLAVVKDGYAYCDFGVGCPQDTGAIYTITGRRLPANVTVPVGEQLQTPVPGVPFYGPAQHKRL